VAAYLEDDTIQSGEWTRSLDDGLHALLAARVLVSGVPSSIVPFDAGFEVEIRYVVPGPDENFAVSLRVANMQGVDIFSSSDTDLALTAGAGVRERGHPPGQEVAIRCSIPGGLLRPGSYLLTPMVIEVRHSHIERMEAGRLVMEVSDVGFHLESTRWGVVTPLLPWHTDHSSHASSTPLVGSVESLND